MSDPRKRSRRENENELSRLRQLYSRLPPEKKKVHRGHMERRMKELAAALDTRGGSDFIATLQMALLVVLVSITTIGVGFFIVTYLSR